MSNVVHFVSKSELERERLIREARAIYDSIFPSERTDVEPVDGHSEETTIDERALNSSSPL